MKTNELMIGDWVLDTRTGTPLRVNPFMAELEVPEWQPIPLTPEILEKNGFEKDFELKGCYWRPDCRQYCIVKEIETWYYAFRHMGGGHICISECNYVHELQHALRLCRVDKEIVL